MDAHFTRFDPEIRQATQQAEGTAAEQHDALRLGREVAFCQLEAAWHQFQAASRASGRALEAARSEMGGLQTMTLTWSAGAPVRTLSMRVTEVDAHISWEVRADFADYGVRADTRSGVLPATELTSDVVHKLIMALLKQDAWGKGTIPEIVVPGSTTA